MTGKKIISLIISIVLCFVVLGASVFIAANADHDCDLCECSVCTAIAECESTIQTLGVAIGVFFILLFTGAVCLTVYKKVSEAYNTDNYTLINLKVELLS